jgi:hypothetical protein
MRWQILLPLTGSQNFYAGRILLQNGNDNEMFPSESVRNGRRLPGTGHINDGRVCGNSIAAGGAILAAVWKSARCQKPNSLYLVLVV